MPKRTNYLPKSITISSGKYRVRIYSKKDKKGYEVGQFDNIETALNKRDEWLVQNYNLVEGYLPRGIYSYRGKYRAQVSFDNDKMVIIESFL